MTERPAPGPLPDLFSSLPDPLAGELDTDRPWDLLGGPLDRALGDLPEHSFAVAVPPEVSLVGDRIVIAAGVRLHPNVVIQGPAYIGPGSEIRPGAFVRGGVWIEEGCVVGANTEVKRAIFCAGARAPHLNYVGDSILGAEANLGAGTILSNFRHDGREIEIPHGEARLATGRRKLGALLGDGSLTGCNCVLHPGVILGRGSQLYPGVSLRPGVLPARSLVKLRQRLETLSLDG